MQHPSPKWAAAQAEALARRQALWVRLVELFREHRPSREQLAQVATLAEVAIAQVFSAHRLPEGQRDERHRLVQDYAECAALYGYVLGYWQARQDAAPLGAGAAASLATEAAAIT